MSREVVALADLPSNWMRRLDSGYQIYLVKERQYASVEFPWQPPTPGRISGRLTLTKLDDNFGHFYRGRTEVWFVNAQGKGFDGQQLILPCEGHLPETLATVVDEQAAALMDTIERLKTRVAVLENKCDQLQKLVKFPFY